MEPNIRDQRQVEAQHAWESAGRRGTVEGATGFGKTRVALNVISSYPTDARILVGVPTQTLRDIDWPQDARQWGVDISHCELICHASLPKIRGQYYHLVVLDEGHHLTWEKDEFFRDNTVDHILVLTATYPSQDDPKFSLLNHRAPSVYKYTLDQAVADGVVADYTIFIVDCPLDDTVKYIESGPKAKRFFSTEKAHFNYLTKQIQRMIIQKKPGAAQQFVYKRTQFLYNLKYTKSTPAKRLMELLNATGDRTLLLAGSIAQVEDIMGDACYHSKKKDKTAFEQFLRLGRQACGAVKALDEGTNIPLLDNLVIVSATSEQRRMIQRIGRVLRYRAGHSGTIFLLQADCKPDREWVESALEGLDKTKIFTVPLAEMYRQIDQKLAELKETVSLATV